MFHKTRLLRLATNKHSNLLGFLSLSNYYFSKLIFRKGQDQKTNGGGIAPSGQNVGSLSRTSWLGKSAGKKDLMKYQFDEQLYYLRVMASSDPEISLEGCGFRYK